MTTFREVSFVELMAGDCDQEKPAEEFDYIFSDGKKLKTDRKLLADALEAGESVADV